MVSARYVHIKYSARTSVTVTTYEGEAFRRTQKSTALAYNIVHVLTLRWHLMSAKHSEEYKVDDTAIQHSACTNGDGLKID